MLRRLIFNLWYFQRPPWDSGIAPPELVEFIQQHQPARAIDIGCGTGTNVLALARAGWQVTGVDFAWRAVRLAKQKIKANGLSANLFVGDATKLKLDEQFELVLDIGCFHGVGNRAAYLDQLTRILAPNGFWLMYGFFKPAPHLSGPGLDAAHLDMIASRGLVLLDRKDSFDKNNRPSVWMLHRKL